jgi:predicted transposase YbfD/YdcC
MVEITLLPGDKPCTSKVTQGDMMCNHPQKTTDALTRKNAEELLRMAEAIPDPRQRKHPPHQLSEIVVTAVVAAVCGANQWTQVEMIAQNLLPWLREFMELKNGIPSHDTYGRVFRLLRPELLAKVMRDWVSKVQDAEFVPEEDHLTSRSQVALDGKCNRRSHDRANGKKAMHMVSAYATQSGLVLACLDVGEKSNEIPAVPEVLQQLELSECVVTMDAMGCQVDTAQLIIDKDADYILALKGNQGKTHAEVKELFAEIEDHEREYSDVKVTTYRQTDHGHGRDEIREYFLATRIDGFASAEKWPGFYGAVKVRSTRIVNDITSVEDRYYITSVRSGVRQVAKGIRDHWGIENCLHWSLDITFREDESRIRKENGPANFATLCRFAHNMLKSEATLKKSLSAKRLMALMNADYRNRVLFQH